MTLAEKLQASKLKAEQAIARQRQLEAQLNKHTRKRDAKLRFILGSGALAGNLVEQCLQHVSDSERTLAREILQEQAAAKAESEKQQLTDKPQNPEQD